LTASGEVHIILQIRELDSQGGGEHDTRLCTLHPGRNSVVHLIAGGIMHETHTFSAEPTPLDAWTVVRGADCDAYAGTNHSLGGVIDACRELDVRLSHTYFAQATSTGPVTRHLFDAMVGELVAGIEAALPADGVVLTLHGAMVAEDFLEAEVEIVRRVKAVVGPEMPVAVTLDLHANIGSELVEQATVIVGYDTYPHIDLNERASEAVHLLVRAIRGEIAPTMALVKPPLLPVPQAMFTSAHPFKTLFDRAFALEAAGEALTISIAGGFPYADAPATGMSILAVTDNDPAKAQAIAQELGELTWSLRHDMLIHNTPPAEAVAEAIAYPEGPVVLVDVGDNIGGGTPGDGTVLLTELLRQGAKDAVVVIADAEAVQAAFAVGVNGTVKTTVGGKADRLHGDPVAIEGRVRLLSDGHWVHDGPENAGVAAEPGPTAVVEVDGVTLVLNSMKIAPGDLQQLKSVGIDPVRQKILVVKAAVRWRGGYGPITKHAIHVATPGLGSVNLNEFDFHHIQRPAFPLDMDMVWP
jgi:microcystin degradation protein MlrC